MNEMKRIQPLMAEIREKYKDDKKKQNEAKDSLVSVRTHGKGDEGSMKLGDFIDFFKQEAGKYLNN